MTEPNAREIAREISSGIRQAQFIGTYTYEILKQSLFSLKNEWNPDAWTESEKLDHEKSLNNLIAEIGSLDDHQKQRLYDDVDSMLTL